MNIAFCTDFAKCDGGLEARLRMAAEAGFTHLHWTGQWNTDFIYSKYEIQQIAKWLRQYNLKLLDIHGSQGQEKHWISTEEYQRKSGVELLANRIRMFAELEGCGALVMHGAWLKKSMTADDRTAYAPKLDAERRSLDELMPILAEYHVKLAQENLPGDTYEYLDILLKEYPAEHFGLTYDSGHGNMNEDFGRGLDWLEAHRDRLLALHLHDNDGVNDLHQPPFMGTVDWERMLKIIKDSPFALTGLPLSFEVNIYNTPFCNQEKMYDIQEIERVEKFLTDAYGRCARAVKIYGS